MWRYTMCILIGQYHQFTIAQCVQIRFIVICSIIQAPGTNQIVNLIILFHRLLLTFAHIQYLALDCHYPIALSLKAAMPLNALVFAESPSVMINTHGRACPPPAFSKVSVYDVRLVKKNNFTKTWIVFSTIKINAPETETETSRN